MGIDELLELIGIKPRQAEAETDAEGNYIAPPEEAAQLRDEVMRRIEAPEPPPTDDLMSIVRRNQGTGVQPVGEVPPHLESAATKLHNQGLREQQALADMERMIEREAQYAQNANREIILRERQNGIRQRTAQGLPPWFPVADPFIDTRVQGPGPTPQAPQYAHLDRAGPPLAGPMTAPDVFLPSTGADIGASVGARGATIPTPPPAPPTPQRPVPTTNPATVPDPAMVGYNPIVNGGPFMTMPPPDPFANPANPAQAPTGSPTTRPPPPTPGYTIPPRRPDLRPPFPFSMPSAALRLTQPAAEGGSMLDGLPTPTPQPPSPFVPEGQLINWWNLGQGQRQPQAQAPAPTARQTAPRTAPTPAPGPDQSTLLNQAELARFLAANGGGTPPPPAPATTPTPPVASNPPPVPTPVPPGATPMTPPAPPTPGTMVPEHLKTQLLEEAARIVNQRRATPQGAPVR